MSVGGNDLFGSNACKVQEWKKDTKEGNVKLISRVFDECEQHDKISKKKSSSTSVRPPRSLSHQSPLDTLPSPSSWDSYYGGGGGGGGDLARYQSRWLELFPWFSDDALTRLDRPLELRSNNEPSDFLQTVEKLLDSQAIEGMKDTSSLDYYSRLFLIPKPNGSFRPIIDLMKLNLFLDVPSFKMETLFSIIAALQPQEWITKIDLKDAYLHILVHVNIPKYFRFVTAGKTYQFRVLPFGLSTAPREFTKTLAP